MVFGWWILPLALGSESLAVLDDDAVIARAGVNFPTVEAPVVAARCVADLRVTEGAVAVTVEGCEAPFAESVRAGLGAWRFAVVRDAAGGPLPALGRYVVRFARDATGERVSVRPLDVVRPVTRVAAPYPGGAVAQLEVDHLSCAMHVRVDASGHADQVDVLDCPEGLQQGTEQALRASSWEPWLHHGQATGFHTNITYRYQLSVADDRLRRVAAGVAAQQEVARRMKDAPRANLVKQEVRVDLPFPPDVKRWQRVEISCRAVVLGGEDGRVEDVDVTGCEPRWAEAAAKGLRQWTFEAGVPGAKLRPFVQRYKIEFRQHRDLDAKRQTGDAILREVRVRERTTAHIVEEVAPDWQVGSEAYAEAARGCKLQVLIGPRGRMEGFTSKHCPPPVLNPLVAALQRWEWEPLMLGERALTYKTTVATSFRGHRYQLIYPNEADAWIPALPAYPEGKPAPESVRMVPPALATVKTKVSIQPEDLRGELPEGEVVCSSVVFVDAKGVPYHVELLSCPAALQWGTYKSVMQWRFEPVEIDEAKVAVRVPLSFHYNLRQREE